jgi:hypothetical protein
MKTELSKILLNGLGFIFSVIIIWLANTGRYFGKTLNYILKCKDNPEYPFPCYGVYDIWIIVIFLVAGVYFLIKVLYLIYKINTGN